MRKDLYENGEVIDLIENKNGVFESAKSKLFNEKNSDYKEESEKSRVYFSSSFLSGIIDNGEVKKINSKIREDFQKILEVNKVKYKETPKQYLSFRTLFRMLEIISIHSYKKNNGDSKKAISMFSRDYGLSDYTSIYDEVKSTFEKMQRLFERHKKWFEKDTLLNDYQYFRNFIDEFEEIYVFDLGEKLKDSNFDISLDLNIKGGGYINYLSNFLELFDLLEKNILKLSTLEILLKSISKDVFEEIKKVYYKDDPIDKIRMMSKNGLLSFNLVNTILNGYIVSFLGKNLGIYLKTVFPGQFDVKKINILRKEVKNNPETLKDSLFLDEFVKNLLNYFLELPEFEDIKSNRLRKYYIEWLEKKIRENTKIIFDAFLSEEDKLFTNFEISSFHYKEGNTLKIDEIKGVFLTKTSIEELFGELSKISEKELFE